MVHNIIIESKTYNMMKSAYKDKLLDFILHIPLYRKIIKVDNDVIFVKRTVKWKPFSYLFYNKEIVYFPETKLHFTMYLCSKREYEMSQKRGYITNLLIYNKKDIVVHS